MPGVAGGKYASLAPEAIERVYATMRARYPKQKDAEKAAKAALHQMSGAFAPDGGMEKAWALMESDAPDALFRALRLHASTAERLSEAEALYEGVFAVTGRPNRVADLACGLNPLWLGARGCAVSGVDAHGGAVALVNAWAEKKGWDVHADCADLLGDSPLPQGDVTLMMKLMPLLERQKKGAAMALLSRVTSPFVVVTFPTRTLSGRGVGMEAQYGAWFEEHLPSEYRALATLRFRGELCYVVGR